MRLGVVYFTAMILTALALAPAAAQLLELPGRMALTDQDYTFVQQVNRGWAWTWILAPLALGADVLLVFTFRQRGGFKLVSLAALLMACTILVSAVWIYPVDQLTASWAVLPANWVALRAKWEYAHATNALLIFLALCALTLSVPVVRRTRVSRRRGYAMDIWYLR